MYRKELLARRHAHAYAFQVPNPCGGGSISTPGRTCSGPCPLAAAMRVRGRRRRQGRGACRGRRSVGGGGGRERARSGGAPRRRGLPCGARPVRPPVRPRRAPRRRLCRRRRRPHSAAFLPGRQAGEARGRRPAGGRGTLAAGLHAQVVPVLLRSLLSHGSRSSAAAHRSGSSGTVRVACRWSGGQQRRRPTCADSRGDQAQALRPFTLFHRCSYAQDGN